MFRSIIEQSKYIAVTLRFSILSIFVTFFIIAMMCLIAFNYYKYSDAMTTMSFQLMKESSDTAFQKIANEMRDIEHKCKSSAEQMELNIINSNDLNTLYRYTVNVLEFESSIFPSLQAVSWSDINGSFTMTEKRSGNILVSDIIDRSTSKPTRTQVTRNKEGVIIKTLKLDDSSYDPRTHAWYQQAIESGHTTWSDVYVHKLTQKLGISVTTPVYDKNKKLKGIVNYNIRLDYLRRLIENINLTKNSVIYITTQEGDVLAYPHIVQYTNSSLMKINSLSNAPWIIKSFYEHMESGKNEFILDEAHKRYLVTYKTVSNLGPTDWLIGVVVPMDDFIGTLRKMQGMTVFFSIIILICGIVLVSTLITAVVRPLNKITKEIVKIRNFELSDTSIIHSRIKEVSYMAEALHSMKNGLRSFQKYVPSSLVRQLIESGEDARVGGTKKQICIMFSDINNFTSISEKTSPELLTRHICEYFDELSNIIISGRGTIDKYIGDAIMAFWGAPHTEEQSPLLAAKAAIECIKKLNVLNVKWALEGKPVLATRIGIHFGDAIVGNLGSSERLNYTAIGDSINIASRLENINKIYGTQIIISDTVYQAIKDQFQTRMLDRVTLKGKIEPYYIYELISDNANDLTYDLDQYKQVFENAFSAYQRQEWDTAINYFDTCLRIYPDDNVAKLFIARCEKFKSNTSTDTWNGIWALNEK